MDRADQAEETTERAWEAFGGLAQRGAEPRLVSLCLFCGRAIERVRPEDIRAGKVPRRFCCVECRDNFQKQEGTNE